MPHILSHIYSNHSQQPQTLYRISSRVQLTWFPSSIESTIWKNTDSLRRALPWRNPADIVSTVLHKRDSRIIVGVLEGGLIRNQLIMQTGLCQSFRCCHSLVDDMNDVLDSRGDDTAPSGGSGDQEQRAVWTGDDYRGHGGEWPLARLDIVGHGRDIAEGVGGPGDGKVCNMVSFVVVNSSRMEYRPSISLFMMIPVSGTRTWLPKRRLMVVIAEIARPE